MTCCELHGDEDTDALEYSFLVNERWEFSQDDYDDDE